MFSKNNDKIIKSNHISFICNNHYNSSTRSVRLLINPQNYYFMRIICFHWLCSFSNSRTLFLSYIIQIKSMSATICIRNNMYIVKPILPENWKRIFYIDLINHFTSVLGCKLAWTGRPWVFLTLHRSVGRSETEAV